MTAIRLDVSDLTVQFGGVRAVDGASLAVAPGEIVGLIGPNGSGKTTVLDAITGLVPLAGGTVYADDHDLADYLPEERAALGLVRSFQDCRLYPTLSVEESLLLTVDASQPVGILGTTFQLPPARRKERGKRDRVGGVIEAFGLTRFRHHRTSQLSTGTRRVVDLASVVLANPRLLLLDEPTAGIAQREAEAFLDLLSRLHDVTGATIVLVEHDVPLVFALCTTVVVMATGRVVAFGSPEVVRHDAAALEVYLGASDEALAVSGPHPGAHPNPEGGGDHG